MPQPGKATEKTMNDAQRAYEARRAAKAGMSLEKWLATKEKERLAEKREAERSAAARVEAVTPPKKPGFLKRLLERAERPLK
ncbi:hypothetical protein ACE7GA_01970 [Roseomonas sp. CCTCC AB2023176]|uniref:hypothetical protein n=1 Tax=Roseomonas sp. CCTCC AB2023176 TaxID=3342640 RepID=UPI0035DD1BFF